jgi:LPS-assembly protein
MSGDKLSMNYETKKGVIFNGILKMNQVLFQGDIIYKHGERDFEAIQADYTACTTCPPAWNFTGSRVTGTMGGYAHIRNPLIRIAKVPILWLPYLIVPLNSKRQTGLLFPNWGYSDKEGFSYGQSLFWAIDQNTDATFTGQLYTRRGIRGVGEYRYVLTENSRGKAEYGYLSDKIFTQDQVFKDEGAGAPYKGRDMTNKPLNRWHLKYDHQYELPDNFTHRLNVRLISDLRYPRDFSNEIDGWRDSAIENRMSLTKNTESSHLSADAAYYTNMIKYDPLSENLDAVHRFPEMKYSLAPRRFFWWPISF